MLLVIILKPVWNQVYEVTKKTHSCKKSSVKLPILEPGAALPIIDIHRMEDLEGSLENYPKTLTGQMGKLRLRLVKPCWKPQERLLDYCLLKAQPPSLEGHPQASPP